MIDHLSDTYAKAHRRRSRPVGELLLAGLFWIFAIAAICAFAFYATSRSARQHVAPEAFVGGQP